MQITEVAIKTFSNLNQEEWRQVAGGALFVAGLAFLAYLTRRKKDSK